MMFKMVYSSKKPFNYSRLIFSFESKVFVTHEMPFIFYVILLIFDEFILLGIIGIVSG